MAHAVGADVGIQALEGHKTAQNMPICRRDVGGGDRSRTDDGGFADLCLTTWLRRPGEGIPHNDKRQTTEHMASVLRLTL